MGILTRIAVVFFLICQPAFAVEADQSVTSFPAEDFISQSPVYYSYEKRQWMTARPGTIFSAGEETADFELPYLREKPEPVVYPRWAVARGWNGEVVLAVEILPDGRVGRWQVMKSSGRKMLDLAAVKAVRKWRFAPAKKGGRPILSCIQVPVYFKIV